MCKSPTIKKLYYSLKPKQSKRAGFGALSIVLVISFFSLTILELFALNTVRAFKTFTVIQQTAANQITAINCARLAQSMQLNRQITQNKILIERWGCAIEITDPNTYQYRVTILNSNLQARIQLRENSSVHSYY